MGTPGTESHLHDLGRCLPPTHQRRSRPPAGRSGCLGRTNRPASMTPVQPIIAKELRSYFVSPVVYVVGAGFLLIVGLLAYLYVVFAGAQAIQLMQMHGSAQINLNALVFR